MKKKDYPALPIFMFGNAVTTISRLFGAGNIENFSIGKTPDHIGTEYLVITDLKKSVAEKKLFQGDKVEFVNHNDIKLMKFDGIKNRQFIFIEENRYERKMVYTLDDLKKIGFTARAIIKPVLNSSQD